MKKKSNKSKKPKRRTIPGRKSSSLDFLPREGEMAKRIREFDWAKSPIGKPDKWSPTLKSVITLMLVNRFPMLLWWGERYIQFYNDPYIPIPGLKHPKALGQAAHECWEEIWEVLRPLVDTPFNGGPASYMDDLMVQMNRNNFTEETHFIIAYSAMPDPEAPKGIGGVLATVSEITGEIIGKRQMETLRRLGKGISTTMSETEVYTQASDAFSENLFDIPFALIHTIDADGTQATLVATSGIDKNHTGLTPAIDLEDPGAKWKTLAATVSENSILVADNEGRWKGLPVGAWDVEPQCFVHIPIRVGNRKLPGAVITIALNPYRKFDDAYRNFAQLIADQISLGVNNAIAYQEERKRAKVLEELDRAKTIFFSNISHEFRTPLTLMLGTIEEGLQDPQTNPVNAERMTVAHRNAMRLLKLVNTLLDFSRIESGRQKAIYARTEIAQLTKSLAGNFRSTIEKAGLSLDIRTDDSMGEVYVDRQMWEKIVFNLLSNAFKYTLDGGIRIELRGEKRRLALEVKDTGVGIPEHELPRMFERFHRVENAAGRTYEGTGIGLSLTRELIHLHGGTITVSSKVGKGSIFTVFIPFGKDHLPAEQISETAEAVDDILHDIYVQDVTSAGTGTTLQQKTNGIDRNKASVLVVDDNIDMRGHLKSILGKHFEVATAGNGREALQLIETQKPDLVLSDIMMPIMDGIQLLKEIKANERTAHLPVILLTARAGEESKMEGREMGADDYLVKPFAATELLSRVKAQLSISEKRLEAQRKVEASERRLRTVLLQSPSLYAILQGRDMVITFANDPLLASWGRTKSIVGKPLLEALPEIANQPFPQFLDQVFTTGEIYQGKEEKAVIIKNGKPVDTYYNYVYQPIFESDSSVSGVTVMASDITEQVIARKKIENSEKDLQQKVFERTAELERINKELESFNYVASHDLQEPLRKIQTFTHLVRSAGNEASTTKYLAKIEDSANRMSQLINSILAYSRAATNGETTEVTDLNTVIKNVKEDLELVIVEKKASVESENLPSIHAIPQGMHQLFSNLIGNSLKFSERAPVIRITSKVVGGDKVNSSLPLNPDQRFIELKFSDNGIGFESEYKEQIFKLFQRLHNKSKYSGTGVGLSIVSRIVAAHHGHISADSEIGKGSTFTVWFPMG